MKPIWKRDFPAAKTRIPGLGLGEKAGNVDILNAAASVTVTTARNVA